MSPSLAPTLDDLERAYQTKDPNLAGHQQAEAVIATADGFTVLCSTNPKGEGEHAWLLQLAGDGTLRWERHLNDRYGTGRAFAAQQGGGYVIAGELQRSAMEYQALVLRADADGNAATAAAVGARGATGFTTVGVLQDGSVLAGGATRWKGWIVRFDPALHLTWELPLPDVEEITGLAPLGDGGFVAVANKEKPTAGLGLGRIIAFDGDRRVRWQEQLPAARRGELAAVAVLPDGGVVTAGHSATDEHAKARMWVTRLDRGGAVLWERLLGSEAEEQRGRALAVFPDGSVAVAGDAVSGPGRRSIQVARLGADGAVLWEKTFGGERTDVARGIARADDGDLVVVGSTMSKGLGKTNVWVLRLDKGGVLRWDRAFGSAG